MIWLSAVSSCPLYVTYVPLLYDGKRLKILGPTYQDLTELLGIKLHIFLQTENERWRHLIPKSTDCPDITELMSFIVDVQSSWLTSQASVFADMTGIHAHGAHLAHTSLTRWALQVLNRSFTSCDVWKPMDCRDCLLNRTLQTDLINTLTIWTGWKKNWTEHSNLIVIWQATQRDTTQHSHQDR